MKHLAFLLTFFIISSGLQAQNLSIGVRTGASKPMIVSKHDKGPTCTTGTDSSYSYPATNIYWDKNLFLRYQTGGRYAMELNVNQYRRNSADFQKTTESSSYPSQDRLTDHEEDFYSLSLSFQYEIGINSLKTHPVLRRFKPYMGVTYAISFRQYKSEAEITTNNSTVHSAYKSSLEQSDSRISATYLLNYSLNNHFTISSLVFFEVQPSNVNWSGSGYFYTPFPNSRLGASLGISYNIL